jgi:glycosyltransferase involved in cell wall biosynthesis
MKIAIVASSFLPEQGRLERRVDQLALGLARRGAEVEVLTQGPVQTPLDEYDGVTVRSYPTVAGPLRFTVAPKLWERLRNTAETCDLVDVHTRNPALVLAAAKTRVRQLVFSPGSPVDVFMGWPYARAMRNFIASASQVVCYSEIERDLLCRTIPRVGNRVQVVPDGVDAPALHAAKPFETSGIVVLAVDRLDRGTGVARAIAAMPSLDPEFRLVVVGDGPARDRLSAYAADLRISSRVQFVGMVPDAVLYRWLRTAHVVVSLPGERGTGLQVREARAAGASVVASDIPINRQAATSPGSGHVFFVSPKGSPLDVADAIEEAERVTVLPNGKVHAIPVDSSELVVESTWALYEELIEGRARSALNRDAGQLVGVAARIGGGNGGVRWP